MRKHIAVQLRQRSHACCLPARPPETLCRLQRLRLHRRLLKPQASGLLCVGQCRLQLLLLLIQCGT